jgi:hypothetical protein
MDFPSSLRVLQPMFLQYKQVGKWKEYIWGEKMYILLSLIAKSFLAWFIWGGTLRP